MVIKVKVAAKSAAEVTAKSADKAAAKSADEAADEVTAKSADEAAVISADTSADKAAATLAATFLFLFLALPCLHAQNYPLLTPGFAVEENLEAEREAEKVNTITMYWEPSPMPQIKAGEEAILTLRARNWFSQTPGSAFFMPPVPQGVILTPLAVSDEERAKGIAVKFKIIPLAAGEIVFPARTLQYENIRFQIPVLRLQVNSR